MLWFLWHPTEEYAATARYSWPKRRINAKYNIASLGEQVSHEILFSSCSFHDFFRRLDIFSMWLSYPTSPNGRDRSMLKIVVRRSNIPKPNPKHNFTTFSVSGSPATLELFLNSASNRSGNSPASLVTGMLAKTKFQNQLRRITSITRTVDV